MRYLECYPDGGHFAGKNFVFDPRCAVGPENTLPDGRSGIIGRCLACCAPCDDYAPRCRCSACRLLVLVCDACRGQGPARGQTLRCELCAERHAAVRAVSQLSSDRRLRVLCLHGFRQTASQFRVRQTTSLLLSCRDHRRRVVMIPSVRFPVTMCSTMPLDVSCAIQQYDGTAHVGMTLPLSALISCIARAQGRTAALQRKLKDLVEFVFVDAPHLVPCGRDGDAVDMRPAASRRAWLVSKRQTGGQGQTGGGAEQWRQQTDGWSKSEAGLAEALRQRGPFDGVLGFSQGAAMAAVLCARQQQQQHRLQQQRQQQEAGVEAITPLRFAILCSGYPSEAAEHRRLHEEVGQLQLPTLHVFASRVPDDAPIAMDVRNLRSQLSRHDVPACSDRQVDATASLDLMNLCDPRLRYVFEHHNGHVIPVEKRCIQRFRSFLLDIAAG